MAGTSFGNENGWEVARRNDYSEAVNSERCSFIVETIFSKREGKDIRRFLDQNMVKKEDF